MQSPRIVGNERTGNRIVRRQRAFSNRPEAPPLLTPIITEAKGSTIGAR
jgi:hypothetical protein